MTLTEKQEDRLLISGDRMYWYVGKKTPTGTFTIDATKTPKHIDLTNREEKGRTVTHRGIYQFGEGGWLLLNLVDVNSPRPTDFKGDKSKEGESKLMFACARPEEASRKSRQARTRLP